MSKWEETYVMAVLGMPIYVVLILIPHFARVRKILSVNGAAEANVEPRKTTEEFMKSDNADAAFVRRAVAAHQNGWETFILFVGAVLAAASGGVKPEFVNTCCLIVLVARFLYNIFYLAVEGGPLSFIRSLCFFVAIGANMAMAIKGCIEVTD